MNNLLSPQAGASNRRGISGFTLVELMVSIVIGMVLIIFISSLYLNSKASFRLNDDNARLQEDGNYALTLIGRNLMQAGYGAMRTVSTTSFTGKGLVACDNGFASPLAATPSFTCSGTAGEPGFTVSYSVDAYDSTNSPISGIGADCNGNNAGGTAVNSFFIATKSGETSSSLFCNGNGSTVSQPILNNVDHMVLTYGVDTTGVYAASQFLSTASAVSALPLNAANKGGWNQLVSITVCLEVHSENIVTTAAQTYQNCAGASTTATDKKLHATLTRTFTLRNRAAPSLT
jgi:type IV pilus assembly protein PilW